MHRRIKPISSLEYRYCPYCGTKLDRRFVFGATRPVCPNCGFVYFQDPKVAVIGLVTAGRNVMLVRRGVEPAKGQWALPGGYMDAGEMPDEALAREIKEEVGLELEAGRLLGIFSLAKTSRIAGGIVIAYELKVDESPLPALQHNDDVDAAEWFSVDEIPEQVAFESSQALLAAWIEDNSTHHNNNDNDANDDDAKNRYWIKGNGR